MASKCYQSVKLDRMRVTKLTSVGAPDTGSNKGYVTDAAVELGLSFVITEGDEGEQKNGSGNVCASFKDPDRIKRVDLSVELCELDYELLAFLTQGDTFEDGSGNIVGYQPPAVTADLSAYIAVEAWTRAWNDSSQAADSFVGSVATYHLWVFPKCQFVLGDVTLDNAIHVFSVNGKSEENSALTANGPHNDWPAQIADEGGVTRVFGVFLTGTIPTAACGSISVPAGSA